MRKMTGVCGAAPLVTGITIVAPDAGLLQVTGTESVWFA